MKRYLSLFLLLAMVLALLSGCGKDPKPTTPETTPPATTPPPTATTSPSGTTEDPTTPTETVSIQWPVNEAGSSLIEYDPDREIFFLLGNADYTVYKSLTAVPGYMFEIFSKNPIDPSTIQASIPLSGEYTVRVSETKLYREENFQNSNAGLSLDVYRGYRKAAGESDFLQGSTAAYDALKPEELPVFYAYRVHIMAPAIQEGSFETVRVQIGETVYEYDIGQVRFETLGTLDELAQVYDRNLNHGASGYRLDVALYNDGLHRADQFYKFTADRDMTLTSLRFMNPNIKLLDVILHIKDTSGMTMEYIWDQSQPVFLMKGDEVQIDVIMYDPAMKQLDYQTKVWGALTYSYSGGTLIKLSEYHTWRSHSVNHYELCAIIFDGIDMEPYYREDLEKPDQAWRENYKEYLN